MCEGCGGRFETDVPTGYNVKGNRKNRDKLENEIFFQN